MIETVPPSTPEDIKKAADAAVGQIEKDHGKGSIIRMSDKHIVKVQVIPSGIHNLDNDALGVGGFPRGRIIEIYGPEMSGKTTLALRVIAESQKAGLYAAFIDVEHALDPTWAQLNGVDVANLYVSQPDYGEQALQITESLLDSKAFGAIVVDSVAALVPKAELEGEIGDSNVGLQARLMSQAMRILNSKVSKANAVLIFINQIREKIGVMFGSPETTTGGRALKFYASVRLDIRRKEQIKEGDVVIGSRTRIKVVKNKVAAPFKETEVDLLFGIGLDTVGSLFDASVRAEVVEKSGSWYSFQGNRMGQGRMAAITLMRTSEALREKIHQALLQKEAA